MKFMFDRRLVLCFDWGLLILLLVLCALGLTILFSAVSTDPGPFLKTLYFRQWIWYCAGAAVMTAVFLTDYRKADSWAWFLYTGAMLLLAAVLVMGKYAGGSRRWLVFGPLTLQPSELAKIAVIIVLARCYSRRIRSAGLTLSDMALPAILTLIPFCLIVKQPDLGTAMIVLLIAASLTMFMKIEKRTFAILTFLSALAAGTGWFFLKDYQKQRILTFLNPEHDPLGAGYHIIQSKIAIGSGMLTGKGWRRGTQNILSFLPEQHTDFIFAVLAEEWGFAGGIFLILLFLVLVIWGLNIAYQCRNPFGTILAVGATSIIFWQAVINLAMVMGLLPVVGVPLPLVSYGGSSVMTIMICTGLLMSISMRRFVTE
ncbi:MAG: rod shape-determining protein RodA [Desulfobacterales bacterium]